MALTLEGGNAIWQRVKAATAGSNEAAALGAQSQLKALRQYLATFGKNPKLQFVAIDGTACASDGGNTASQVLANAACRLYAIYLKKVGTTACWFKGTDHASTATTDGTQAIAEHDANNDTVPVGMTGQEIVRVWLGGKSLANGLTITEDTTATGSTLTLKANRFDGFAIIGAP